MCMRDTKNAFQVIVLQLGNEINSLYPEFIIVKYLQGRDRDRWRNILKRQITELGDHCYR